jgi:hypothetical protein
MVKSRAIVLPALVALATSAAVPRAIAQDTADTQRIGDRALSQIQALQQLKLQRTPAQLKMDSHLLGATSPSAMRAAAPDLETDLRAAADGRILVDITTAASDEGGLPTVAPTTTASAAPSLTRRGVRKPRELVGLFHTIDELGGSVVSSVPQFRAVRALMPLSSLETLAASADVAFVEPAAEAMTNTGSVNGQGDTTHRAGATRTVFGVTGAGVSVGVLSDSEDGLVASQGLGDLGAVTVVASGINVCGDGDDPCTGEGTAMMEIVADLAPGVGLFFATAFTGAAQMAANILALQAAGCSVIVDDVTYFNESPFQDGPIAQAVNTVSAAGVLYFSSARNSGNLNDGTSGTWEGDFVDGGPVAAPLSGTGRLHSFGGTTFNTVAGGTRRRVDLFWTDPLGGSGNDYDLFVLNSTGTTVLRSSTNAQTGSQNPYEFVTTLNVGERIVIVRAAGAANRFIHLDTGRAILAIGTNGSVRGHNASGAANAFSVAATDVANSFPGVFAGGATNPVETFSSDGPRRIFFTPTGTPITPGNFSSTGGQVLQKPDITAADGVASSAALPALFNPFFGTSAAAPHAAAIAALLLSLSPAPTPAQIHTALTSSALDIEAAGFDRDSGAGIIRAFAAMKVVNPCTVTCPANLTRPNDLNQCGAATTFAAPTLAGGCGPTVTCGAASGAFFPVGTTPVACVTASEDTCSFNVTVQDSQPPAITCPANLTVPTAPGVCTATVGYPAVTATDNCPGVGAVTCAPPSGTLFPLGTSPAACSVADTAGNPAGCGFSVTVQDKEAPKVFSSVATPRLWPADHHLVNVGLTLTATDNCAGPLPLTLKVSGDEDDEMPTGDGKFSPDARNIAPGTLRLRRERRGDADGRVYLTLGRTADTAGNLGFACSTVVVPRSGGDTSAVDAQAAAAQAFCSANGAPPPGYFVVGDGALIGPKQ